LKYISKQLDYCKW